MLVRDVSLSFTGSSGVVDMYNEVLVLIDSQASLVHGRRQRASDVVAPVARVARRVVILAVEFTYECSIGSRASVLLAVGYIAMT